MSSTSRRRKRQNSDGPPAHELQQQLQAIVTRLNALEGNSFQHINEDAGRAVAVRTPPLTVGPTGGAHASSAPLQAVGALTPPPPTPPLSTLPPPTLISGIGNDSLADATEKLVSAINTTMSQVRPNIFISSFDPSINDFDLWCSEVDYVRSINRWDDRECLSRIGNCLKGEARIWLNQWVSNDRTWSNFKIDFKALCPRQVDTANVLYEVMSTNSDKYHTYAEYARRSLLRLKIVDGLSSELLSAIIIRGITDPQIRAAATNAKLMPNDLVEFFANFVKPRKVQYGFPKSNSYIDRDINRNPRKREHNVSKSKCFSCGTVGHRQFTCPKRPRIDHVTTNDSRSNLIMSNNSNGDRKPCSYCKKIGHSEDVCFTKQRSESRNKSNVNFCREIVNNYKANDITAAIIQGVPIDILIDSGSTISLISDSVINHLKCKQIPSFRLLRGIGKHDVESLNYTKLSVEFPEITLEIDFHIISDCYMSTPVIVGTDVLNRDGVAYVRTKGEHRLIRRDRVQSISSSFPVAINTPLQGEEKKSLLSIINNFSEHLITGTATSTVKTGSMQIRLKNETPVVYRPYKMSYDEKLRVREIVKDLKDKGVIRDSNSEYSSPILLVKKKDGSDRMCVDFRALNANTVKDHYPLPLIDDHIDRLGKCKYFTSLDMATGFHQIRLDPESVPLTGFVTPEGHYEYVKMPYGLTNAPIVYQKIISNTLRSFIDSGKVLVYIDDILIPSMTVQEGLQTLCEVLTTLTEAGFSVNLKKCVFLSEEIEYLGRTIANGQVKPSKHKVDALVRAPVPSNVKQVRQFLGLAGYFRRYIPNYSLVTACIANLLRQGVEFRWGDEQERVRKEIIDHLTRTPALGIFDPSLPTEVHTDASSLGYGAVLLQTRGDGRRHVVAYYSKVTQGAESRYHSYELETLAVVKALQHFRHYLIGIHFTVVTDCNALKLTQKKKDLLPRVARWWVYLQDYDFELQYRKGSMMSHADYLSRNPVNICEITRPQNWAQLAQAADDETQMLIEKLNNGELDTRRYIVRNDTLYYKHNTVGEQSIFLCYIPKGHRLSLLRIFHDEHQHIGVEKTTELILKHFWFPGLRSFVRKYIQHCIVCLSHKKIARQPHQPIESWSKPDTPFETVHSDVLGPLPDSNGYKFIIIIVDAFTKFSFLFPIYRQDASELKRVFEMAISYFGVPKLIVVDRGRMYESEMFTKWIKDIGSDLYFITPEMHQSNGQAERYCRTILNMIRVEVNFRNEAWNTVLWKIQLSLNVTRQKSTQYSPLNLLIGSEVATPAIRSLIRDVAVEGNNPNREALREMARQRASGLLDQNRAHQDARVNERRKPPRTFTIGDVVFVHKRSQTIGKMDSGMRGPYKVTKTLPHGRYDLVLLAGSYGKKTQAAAEYMTLWRGEWTPDVCSAFFEGKFC